MQILQITMQPGEMIAALVLLGSIFGVYANSLISQTRITTRHDDLRSEFDTHRKSNSDTFEKIIEDSKQFQEKMMRRFEDFYITISDKLSHLQDSLNRHMIDDAKNKRSDGNN